MEHKLVVAANTHYKWYIWWSENAILSILRVQKMISILFDLIHLFSAANMIVRVQHM